LNKSDTHSLWKSLWNRSTVFAVGLKNDHAVGR
jgi:hypothetical protein